MHNSNAPTKHYVVTLPYTVTSLSVKPKRAKQTSLHFCNLINLYPLMQPPATRLRPTRPKNTVLIENLNKNCVFSYVRMLGRNG